jgi:hypothetical protein
VIATGERRLSARDPKDSGSEWAGSEALGGRGEPKRNPTLSVSWKKKTLARPLRGLASRF